MVTGRCLCGAVEYSVEDRFEYAGYCHCTRCRAATGSAFATFAGIRADRCRVVKGADAISDYRRNDDNLVRFCGTCRSPLYSIVRNGEYAHIQMGTLVDTPEIRPQFHIFVDSRAPWHEITDSLPQYSGYPPL